MREIFFEVFFSLVRLFLNTKDEFLKQKLVKKTKEFFDAVQSPDDVAQSRAKDKLKLIDDLNELVEIVLHLKLVSLSPALTAQKDLLHLRAQIMNAMALENQPKLAIKIKSISKTPVFKGTDEPRGIIITYLKSQSEGVPSGKIAKDLGSQFSRRTLQRHLNDLVKEGLVNKFKEENFPFSKYGLK